MMPHLPATDEEIDNTIDIAGICAGECNCDGYECSAVLKLILRIDELKREIEDQKVVAAYVASLLESALALLKESQK